MGSRNGGPDSFLVDPISQLHEGLLIQADKRNAALNCFVYNATRGWTQPGILSYFTKLLNIFLRIVLKSVCQSLRDPHCSPGCIHARIFFHITEHYKIFSFFISCAPGPAKTTIHTSQGLQFQCDMLDHVAHPGPFLHPLKEATRLALATAM